MRLYILRHAKAESQKVGQADVERQLTPLGQEEFAVHIKTFTSLYAGIEVIYTSPVRRAVQTAELLKSAAGLQAEIIKDPAFAPGSELREMIRAMNGRHHESAAIIGHEPDCSYHTGELTGGQAGNIQFKPGTTACLSITERMREGTGTLLFFLPVYF